MPSARRRRRGAMQTNIIQYLMSKNVEPSSRHPLLALPENTGAKPATKRAMLSSDDDEPVKKVKRSKYFEMAMLASDEDEPVEKKVKSPKEAVNITPKEKNAVSDDEGAENIRKNGAVSTYRNCATNTLRNRAKTPPSILKTEASTSKENLEAFCPGIMKTEEEEEDSELQHTGLSEYEQMIQRNIKERQKFLESLEIFKVKEELNELKPQPVKKPTYRGIATKKVSPEPVVRRRSLRQQNLTPDGLHLPLPSDKEVARAEATSEAERHPRPPPGPAPIMDYYTSNNTEEFELLIKDFQTVSFSGGGESVWSGSMKRVLQTMKTMEINEDRVAKVVPQRTFSVQVHPTLDKTLVLVGGKWGELGIWDVERGDETSGAYYVNPHSRPINCLTVDPWNPQYVYTTSYDGSLRRTDLTAGIVQQVYSYVDEEVYNLYCSCHAHVFENSILVGASKGEVIHVDTRAGGKELVKYLVHNNKSVKVVTVHPTQNQYFATASRDGNVCLWDMRHHKKNSPVATHSHGRNVTGLEFSPLTGKSLISTCMDDNLRFLSCDLKDLTVERKIKHNNQTGRWLTTFKARFVPFREDLIVVGSLMQPRRVEVWGCDGELKHTFMGEHFGSVASVTALHPTLPVLAGCNSSGRVHVFK